MANERKCIICGKTYQYCPTGCGNTNIFAEPWKYTFDTYECNEIYNICCRFIDKKITKEEAKMQLNTLKLPQSFVDNIKKTVNEINSEESKEIKTEKINNTDAVSSEITVEKKSNPVQIINRFQKKQKENMNED